jgi:hypothetical protein
MKMMTLLKKQNHLPLLVLLGPYGKCGKTTPSSSSSFVTPAFRERIILLDMEWIGKCYYHLLASGVARSSNKFLFSERDLESILSESWRREEARKVTRIIPSSSFNLSIYFE